MPFVKLDCDILESSLWDWTPERHIFITALLMAKPHELKEPTPQIGVSQLEPTGWVVPPGQYGFVRASGAMILKKALGLVHTDQREESKAFTEGMAALNALGQPDEDSRSSDYEGRRLVRIDGGYIALNYQRYREKDHTATERKRRQREREREREREAQSRVTSRQVTQAEAEAYKIPTTSATAKPSQPPILDPIWHIGLAMLGDTETSRKFLGKLCKDNGDTAVRRAVSLAVDRRPANAKSFLTATAKGFKATLDKTQTSMKVGKHEESAEVAEPKCPVCRDLGKYLPEKEYSHWAEMKFEDCPKGCPERI